MWATLIILLVYVEQKLAKDESIADISLNLRLRYEYRGVKNFFPSVVEISQNIEIKIAKGSVIVQHLMKIGKSRRFKEIS